VKSGSLEVKNALLQKILLWPAVVILLFSGPLSSQTTAQKVADNPSIANFTDIAQKAGLNAVNVFGGVDSKK